MKDKAQIQNKPTKRSTYPQADVKQGGADDDGDQVVHLEDFDEGNIQTI